MELNEINSNGFSDNVYNYMAWSAAHFNQFDFLTKLMYQANVLNVKINLQTYIKCNMTLFKQQTDNSSVSEQDYLTFFTTMFMNDCHSKEFTFANKMLDE